MQINPWDEPQVVEFKGLHGPIKDGTGPVWGYVSRSKKVGAVVRVVDRLVFVPFENLRVVTGRKKRKKA